MLNTILVPLDGSALAERALPFARAIAQSSGAQLLLLHLARGRSTEPEAEHEDPVPRLEAVRAALRAAGLQAELKLRELDDETAGAAIARLALETGSDLIVMSSHGRGGLGRWLYGSVADEVMRLASLPLIVVPAASKMDWPAQGRREILVSLDGSETGEASLSAAADLVRTLGGRLFLLRVVEIPTALYAEGLAYTAYDPEAELEAAKAYLAETAARLRQEGLDVQTSAEVEFPVSAIVALAQEREVDLIAMATHGRGGLARLVLGSVATGVLQRAGRPVLLVRPGGIAETRAEAEPPVAAAEPTASLALSGAELRLLRHALGDLLYSVNQDWRLAKPARSLLERLR